MVRNIFRFVIMKANPLANETLICIHERGIITELESVEIRNKIILLSKKMKISKQRSIQMMRLGNETLRVLRQSNWKIKTDYGFQFETISVSGYCFQPLINQIKSKNIGGSVWNTFLTLCADIVPDFMLFSCSLRGVLLAWVHKMTWREKKLSDNDKTFTLISKPTTAQQWPQPGAEVSCFSLKTLTRPIRKSYSLLLNSIRPSFRQCSISFCVTSTISESSPSTSLLWFMITCRARTMTSHVFQPVACDT